MADLYDAVVWQNLLPLSGAVMGYADGPVSMWPAEAWQALARRPHIEITVLANDLYPVFDSESGNAGVAAVATAVANRLQDKQWSVVYTNRDNLPGLTAALRSKGLAWRDAQFWPQPGVYLHAADPTGTSHLAVAWAPVQPVAVQDRWMGGYDISTCYGSYPVVPAPAPPPPHPQPAPVPQPVEVAVQVPVLSEQSPGPNAVSAPVRNLQALLLSHGFTVGASGADGRFGPATAAAVVACEHHYGLEVDEGIAGNEVWTALCTR